MFSEALRSQSGPVLVTGHTGFKGAWLSLFLEYLNIENYGFSLDANPGSLFSRLGSRKSTKSTIGDVRDLNLLRKVFREVQPSIVVHMAAQPLVLRSYDEPLETFSVNVLGTANILEAAFSTPSVKVVLVVTTDKVYRNHESGVRFKESDALAGKDPYSASKVGAESVCAAWQQISKVSGGPKVIVARAGNVIGGGDFSENRIIPDIIRGVIANKPTLIRNPISTRPWQHVLDPLAGYLSFIEQTLNGSVQSEVFNFGPCESSLSVQELVEIGKETFGERLQIKLGSPDGEKEATTLELDSSSALEKISWRPKWSQREAIRLTFEWWNLIIADNKHAYKRCLHEIEEFLAKT